MNLDTFHNGQSTQTHHQLGAFPTKHGVVFRVWAPRAQAVAVVGDFNGWNDTAHGMHKQGSVWTIEIAQAKVGQHYKYAITSAQGTVWKTDPFAKAIERPPQTASIISDWKVPKSKQRKIDTTVMSIYELHLGSWKSVDGQPPTFRNIADSLIDYARKLNITHIEFMPITHHPFYGSWGYQCLGYFAPLANYGTLNDLRWLIDRLHEAGLGCILDWVPAHFPMDQSGLYRFDGEALFEHPDPRRGYHPDWNTAIFDYGRPEVRSFLLSSARFWLEELDFDGLRVDAVSSMLYLNYSRNEGEWLPNHKGGHEHLEAIQFFHELHQMVANLPQQHFLIAEESTSWPKVSGPPNDGGIGFDYKWDMGWMHDTLQYLSREPIHRQYHHDELLFRGVYRFHERFVLALSHDEVVHGKGSLVQKMSGDPWQRFATCRLLFAMMIAQPGKKLLFMGMEFGQVREWNHDRFLDWDLLEHDQHRSLQACYGSLNGLYRTESALHDDSPSGVVHSEHRDPENSVMLIIRQHQGACMVCLFNCTPNPITDYAIGVPKEGQWSEVMNTDAKQFGGSGLVAQFSTHAHPTPLHGLSQQITVGIPPLGASFWKWEGL